MFQPLDRFVNKLKIIPGVIQTEKSKALLHFQTQIGDAICYALFFEWR